MKKILFIILTLTLFISSCSKEELKSENRGIPEISENYTQTWTKEVKKKMEPLNIPQNKGVSIPENRDISEEIKWINNYVKPWSYSIVQDQIKNWYHIIVIDPNNGSLKWDNNNQPECAMWWNASCKIFIFKEWKILYENVKENQFSLWWIDTITNSWVIFTDTMWEWTICGWGGVSNHMYYNFESGKMFFSEESYTHTCKIKDKYQISKSQNTECSEITCERIDKSIIKYFSQYSDKKNEYYTNKWTLEDTYFDYMKNNYSFASFSEENITNILKKIDENIKTWELQRQNTGTTLIQWDFKAEYIWPKDYSKDTDKIIVTLSWKTFELPWVYGATDIINIKKCTKLNNNITYEDIVHNMECPFWKFWSFSEFSPSWYYLLYNFYGYEYGESRLIDSKNGNNILKIPGSISAKIWTWDKKQFIYWTVNGIVWSASLVMTKKWSFPEQMTIQDKRDVLWIDVDENYIYSKEVRSEWLKWYYLKIYRLSNWEEIFSKTFQ